MLSANQIARLPVLAQPSQSLLGKIPSFDIEEFQNKSTWLPLNLDSKYSFKARNLTINV